MKYPEPKERSAELLRLALGHMGRHDAAFNPITFTVWYEYVAGTNPKLQAAVDVLIHAGARLDNERVAGLFRDYVAPSNDASVQRIGGEMRRVMTEIAESASRTGERAGAFDAQLNELASALQGKDSQALSPQLREALDGTAEMRSSAQALQQQLQTSQGEIARLREALDRARVDAWLDPLTQILNRKGFEQRLQALFDEPAGRGQSHCLIMFDIDHFKRVNDTHGHVMGDRVIQGVAQVIRASLTDATHSAARYGGEEFAIVVPHTTLADATRIAETVRARTKAMKIRQRANQDVLFSITVSAGVAALQPGNDAASLIARADAALYQSKNSGRDRVSCA